MLTTLACIAFLTAPADKPLYRFAAYGDGRGHFLADTNMSVQTEILTGAMAAKPKFIIQTGDLVFDGSNQGNWDSFEKYMQPLWRSKIAYYPARGNHDNVGESKYLEYMKRLIVPTWRGNPRTDNLIYYAYDQKPLRFISIDTEQSTAPGSPQHAWIDKELAAARKRGLVPIPYFHKAIHSIGSYAKETPRRGELEPLFQKYRVPLVFQGHDHNYYRTKRRGTVYVITGGGGAPLYEQGAGRNPRGISDPEDQAWPDVGSKTYHYCVGTVYKNRIDVTVRAIRYDGPNPIDAFTVPLH
jgi:acid phosphatase type 7